MRVELEAQLADSCGSRIVHLVDVRERSERARDQVEEASALGLLDIGERFLESRWRALVQTQRDETFIELLLVPDEGDLELVAAELAA